MISLHDLHALDARLRDRLVLTLYGDGAATDPAERTHWRRAVENGLRSAEAAVATASRDERVALEASVAAARTLLSTMPGYLGAPGWVAIATEQGIEFTDRLPAAMPSGAWWRRGPRLAPLWRALQGTEPVAVAIVSARDARVLLLRELLVMAEETHHHVEASAQHIHPRSAPSHFHQDTRGATGKDAHAKALREASRAVVRDAAADLVRLAGPDGVMVIGGVPELAHQVLERLSPAARTRAVIVPDLSATDPLPVLIEKAHDAQRRLTDGVDTAATTHLLELNGGPHRAVIGLVAAAHALRAGWGDRLELSWPLVVRDPDAVEPLIQAAFDTGASVRVLEGDGAQLLEHRAAGVALRLRWPIEAAAATALAGYGVVGGGVEGR